MERDLERDDELAAIGAQVNRLCAGFDDLDADQQEARLKQIAQLTPRSRGLSGMGLLPILPADKRGPFVSPYNDVDESEEEDCWLSPGCPLGSVARVELTSDRLAHVDPGGVRVPLEVYKEQMPPAEREQHDALSNLMEAAGWGLNDSERTPEQRVAFRMQIATGRRHNGRVRRERMVRLGIVRWRESRIVRRRENRPRSRGRSARIGARGKCRAGPSQEDPSEPAPARAGGYSFSEHLARYEQLPPHERLEVFYSLPLFKRAEAWSALRAEIEGRQEAW